MAESNPIGGYEELELALTGPGDVVEYIEDGQRYTITATATGINFPRGLPYHAWEAIGNQLKIKKTEASRDLDWALWALGDWLSFGEGNYGERHAQALDETDYATGTLHNIASVANRVEHSRRREDQSFWNHSEVAKLDPPQQTELLEKASTDRLRKMEIREEANKIEREQFGKAATPVWDECPTCVGHQYPPGKVPHEEPPDG